MILFGIDTETVGAATWERPKTGRVLILDADGPAYVAAATVKRLDTAIRRFQQDVLTRMFLTRCASARLHLTSNDSTKFGRFNVKAAKPYQGNRTSKAKPPLLEPLREAMCLEQHWLPEFEFVKLHRDIEADDAMMEDAYSLKDNGVTNSADKDLRMTPYPYYEETTGIVMPGEPVGKLWITPKGKRLGQGPLFFWAQMLMGDTADNIKGIEKLNGKLCGAVAAYNALHDCTNIDDAANRVLDGYRAIDQNAVAEAWLLWLRRSPTDNVVQYLKELNLSQPNYDFIQHCLARDWVIRENLE